MAALKIEVEEENKSTAAQVIDHDALPPHTALLLLQQYSSSTTIYCIL